MSVCITLKLTFSHEKFYSSYDNFKFIISKDSGEVLEIYRFIKL